MAHQEISAFEWFLVLAGSGVVVGLWRLLAAWLHARDVKRLLAEMDAKRQQPEETCCR